MVPALARRSAARVLALEFPVPRALARAVMGLAVCVGLLAGGAARGAGPMVGWGAGAPTPMISASAIAVGGDLRCAIQADSGVDLEVPVWKVLSEYDVNGFNEPQVRRPDDGFSRTWEVPGTSPNDRKSCPRRTACVDDDSH